MTRLILLAALLWAPVVHAQEASLTIAGEQVAGGRVSVAWTGPDGQNDWVGVADPGAPGDRWVAGSWTYANAGNPVSVTLPAAPGTYEMRYVTGASEVLAAQEITVAAAPETESAAPARPSGAQPSTLPSVALDAMIAPEGATLSVALDAQSPRGAGDRITIALVGAGPEDESIGSAMVPVEGPVAIDAPATAGEYELRYVATQSGQPMTLGSAPLTVVGADYKRRH